MILLFTDFGWEGPYVGQMKAAVVRSAPDVPVIDLMHDAPAFDPYRSAYLLAALGAQAPAGSVLLSVVDPGVGSARLPIVVEADGRWYVGPENGLFALAARHSRELRAREIIWRPDSLSKSFHGRDLFAPVAAGIAADGAPAPEAVRELPVTRVFRPEWPDDLSEVVYVDRFGNSISGIRGENLSPKASIMVHNVEIKGETTFSDAPDQGLFWYVNSHGLVEIASNKGQAAKRLNIKVGTVIESGVNQPVTAGR